MDNGLIFLFTLVLIYSVAGLIWVLTKYLSMISLIVIPILCSLIAMLFRTNNDMLNVVAISIFALLGILGTFSCSLFASILKLEQEVKSIKGEMKKEIGEQ